MGLKIKNIKAVSLPFLLFKSPKYFGDRYSSLEQAKSATFANANQVRQIIFFTIINFLPETLKVFWVKPLKVVNPDLSGPWYKLIISKALQTPLFLKDSLFRTFWKNYSGRKLDYKAKRLKLKTENPKIPYILFNA
jgi:hypothetical protein